MVPSLAKSKKVRFPGTKATNKGRSPRENEYIRAKKLNVRFLLSKGRSAPIGESVGEEGAYKISGRRRPLIKPTLRP